MNNEIKFRFVFKTIDGRIFTEIFEITDLVNRFKDFMFGLHDVNIISKDRYIGRNDKNGNEMYEGDIVKFHKGYVDDSWTDSEQGKPFVIEWRDSDGYLGFSAIRENKFLIPGAGQTGKYKWNWEIIGNIHAENLIVQPISDM